MEELVKELMTKANLSEESARKAVETMVEFVKSKLPAGLSDKVEGLLAGNLNLSNLFGSPNEGGGNNPLDKLKGMFGS